LSQFESGCINGDGIGASPTGIRSVSGIGVVAGGTDGAQISFAHLCDLEAAPGEDNASEARPGFLVNSKTRRWLRTQPRGTGLPYVWEGGERPLLGYAAAVTNNVPSDLSKGASSGVCSSVVYSSDWSYAMIAIFGAPDLTVDPVTLARSGQVRITLNLFGAFGALQPAAFATMDDGLTA
jgi:HK97 family phage major capsid protein